MSIERGAPWRLKLAALRPVPGRCQLRFASLQGQGTRARLRNPLLARQRRPLLHALPPSGPSSVQASPSPPAGMQTGYQWRSRGAAGGGAGGAGRSRLPTLLLQRASSPSRLKPEAQSAMVRRLLLESCRAAAAPVAIPSSAYSPTVAADSAHRRARIPKPCTSLQAPPPCRYASAGACAAGRAA